MTDAVSIAKIGAGQPRFSGQVIAHLAAMDVSVDDIALGAFGIGERGVTATFLQRLAGAVADREALWSPFPGEKK